MESSKKERSRAYPSMTLAEALKRLNSINENLGANGNYNRESIVVGMGYSGISGTSSRAAASLDQYGLLRRTKDLYSLTDEAKKYLFPVNPSDQEDAMRVAALSPPLFSDVFSVLEGQVIPKQFANRLIQEFSIQPKAANDVERIFRNTMETAGLLSAGGILNSGIKTDNAQKVDTSDVDAATDVTRVSPATNQELLSVNLPSGLIVSYPQSVASAFAFGIFGESLMALDSKVSEYIKRESVKVEDESDE